MPSFLPPVSPKRALFPPGNCSLSIVSLLFSTKSKRRSHFSQLSGGCFCSPALPCSSSSGGGRRGLSWDTGMWLAVASWQHFQVLVPPPWSVGVKPEARAIPWRRTAPELVLGCWGVLGVPGCPGCSRPPCARRSLPCSRTTSASRLARPVRPATMTATSRKSRRLVVGGPDARGSRQVAEPWPGGAL